MPGRRLATLSAGCSSTRVCAAVCKISSPTRAGRKTGPTRPPRRPQPEPADRPVPGPQGAERADPERPGEVTSMLHGPLRPAYTLLEMLLATAISALLLGALYVAVSMQLRHAQAGRDVIEQTTLARALLTRMGRDIRLCVTPAAPTPFLLGPGPSSGSGSPSGSGSATGSSGQTGSPVGSG